LDLHRVDADPNTNSDPTFHLDAVSDPNPDPDPNPNPDPNRCQDPDPTLSFTHVGNLNFFLISIHSSARGYIVLSLWSASWMSQFSIFCLLDSILVFSGIKKV
jgi:hypothetical protein